MKNLHESLIKVKLRGANRIKLSIKASIEHVFVAMIMSMFGKVTKKIELERTEAQRGLKDLAISILCNVRAFLAPLIMHKTK